VAEATLYSRSPNSWFFGANLPGKPRVFMPRLGGVGAYRRRADDIAANNYPGFELT
jgi:cyclohexanone monooxygenase